MFRRVAAASPRAFAKQEGGEEASGCPTASQLGDRAPAGCLRDQSATTATRDQSPVAQFAPRQSRFAQPSYAVVAAPPDARFVPSPGRPVEPLVHAQSPSSPRAYVDAWICPTCPGYRKHCGRGLGWKRRS